MEGSGPSNALNTSWIDCKMDICVGGDREFSFVYPARVFISKFYIIFVVSIFNLIIMM